MTTTTPPTTHTSRREATNAYNAAMAAIDKAIKHVASLQPSRLRALANTDLESARNWLLQAPERTRELRTDSVELELALANLMYFEPDRAAAVIARARAQTDLDRSLDEQQ